MSRTNRATASPNRTAAMTTSTVPTANHAGLGRFFLGGTVAGYVEGYSGCGRYGMLTRSTLPDFFGGRGFWQNRALSLLRPVPLNRARDSPPRTTARVPTLVREPHPHTTFEETPQPWPSRSA